MKRFFVGAIIGLLGAFGYAYNKMIDHTSESHSPGETADLVVVGVAVVGFGYTTAMIVLFGKKIAVKAGLLLFACFAVPGFFMATGDLRRDLRS